MAKRSLEDIDEYYGGMLPDVNITAFVPSIYTKKGERLAKLMANDVYQGKMQLRDVPKDYYNYVEGEVKGAIPTKQSLNKIAKPIGLAAAGVIGGLGAVQLAPSAIAAYTNFATKHPLLMRGIDTIGTVDGIRNAISKNGIGKTVRLAKEGDVKNAIKSGIGDIFDLTGGIKYVKGVNNRLKESILRQGDKILNASNITDVKYALKPLIQKDGLNYIINPFADKNLAYNIGRRYGGTTVDAMDARIGDAIDQFINKDNLYNFKEIPLSLVPEELQLLIKRRYPKLTHIRTSKLTNVPNTKKTVIDRTYLNDKEYRKFADERGISRSLFDESRKSDFIFLDDEERMKHSYPIRSGQIKVNDKSVLDPGGYHAYGIRKNKDLLLDNYDIYKFNGKDLEESYGNMFNNDELYKNKIFFKLKQLGAKYVDSGGKPILYNWQEQINNYPFVDFGCGGRISLTSIR